MRRIIALAIVIALSGCLDPFRPHVDEDIFAASEFQWVKTEFPQENNNGTFAPKIVQTQYRFDPQNQPPFPALLHVVGVRGWSEVESDDLIEKTRELVNEKLRSQNIIVDSKTEESGGRSLANGAKTNWFRVIGTTTEGDLFQSEEEIRVFAETFYDGRSKTAVIAIAFAQTTETTRFLTVQRTENLDVWRELVGDPFGIIDNMETDAGFIHNLVTHD
ncbi:MAG: hypothetical protein ACPHK8_03725 [Thermoplasmatota archaeon]